MMEFQDTISISNVLSALESPASQAVSPNEHGSHQHILKSEQTGEVHEVLIVAIKRMLILDPTPRNVPDQLTGALSECRQTVSSPNWDEEGARPVEDHTFELAERLLERLPWYGCRIPEIEPTPQGEIVFSWDSVSDEMDSLDVAVLPSGEIAAAGLFGDLKIVGNLERDHKCVKRIVDMVSWTDQ